MEKDTSVLNVEIDNTKGQSKLGFSGTLPEIVNNVVVLIHKMYNTLLETSEVEAKRFKEVLLEVLNGKNVFKKKDD